MGFSYNVNVLNQKGSPALYTDTFANRPPFGYAGRLFIANDTSAIYEDTGTAWVLIANVSSGAGTLQQVTTNGNTSNVGISITAGGLSTNSLTDTALTLGSVLFAGAAGLVTQDNPAFFWDDTNNRLGINTTTPTNTLDLHFAGTGAMLGLNNTAGNQSAIVFANTNVNKWRIGNSATNSFDIFNNALGSNAVSISTASNSVSFLASIKIQQGAGFAGVAGYNGIGCDSGGFFFELGTSTNNPYFNFIGLTGARTYTFPDATGTLALTSNLSSYVPYTGASTNVDLGTNNITAYRSKFWDGTQGLLIGAYTGGANYGAIYPSTVTPGGANFSIAAKSGATTLNTETGGYIDLEIAGVTKMILFNTGNVAIGGIVDDTVNKLQVTGSANITGNFNLPYGSVINWNSITNQYITADSNNLYLGAANFSRITIATTGVVTITNLAGTGSRAVLADASGNLSAPVSDETVKENIEPLKYGLDAIMQLNPISFEYIDKYKNYGEGLQIGNIAQDIEKVIPEAVFTTPSTGLKGINYNQFDGIYIKAIQDLNNIIDSLLKRIEALENK